MLEEEKAKANVSPSSAYSAATLKGAERQVAIENTAELLGSRLEALRNRSNKLKVLLPAMIFAPEVLKQLYGDKKPNSEVLSTNAVIQDLTLPQLIYSINKNLVLAGKPNKLFDLLKAKNFGTPAKPVTADVVRQNLINIAYQMNNRNQMDNIAFANKNISIPLSKIVESIVSIKNNPELISQLNRGHQLIIYSEAQK
jgi:hypothetical protein